MPFEIVSTELTKLHVDAIVNAVHESLHGELRAVGEVKLIAAAYSPEKYVIHTVSPAWQGGRHGEAELLAACYRNSLALAGQHGISSIAFPLITTGSTYFSKRKEIKIAKTEITAFLESNPDLLVYLVVPDKSKFVISHQLLSAVEKYVQEHLYDEHFEAVQAEFSVHASVKWPEFVPAGLEETFAQKLLRLITEKGYTDAAVYKRANIDRKLFSKIRNDANYHPKKQTAIAFAIALELDIEDTQDLLDAAGYTLSNSLQFDVVIKYFIESERYNIYEINEVLFTYNLPLLGY